MKFCKIAVLFAIFFIATLTTACIYKKSQLKAKLVDSNYMVWDEGKWRVIMLPGTELGLNMRWAKAEEDGKLKWSELKSSKNKKGRPSEISDCSEKYINKVKVVEYHQVENGNYCVKCVSPSYINSNPPWNKPMWTVWHKDLFEKVKKAQIF